MAEYCLNSLIHRSYSWTANLPDGTTVSGTTNRDIAIKIPKIQRDYAEGRTTESIVRKRRNLLSDMLDVVYGVRSELSFDFVYGTIKAGDRTIASDDWKNESRDCVLYFEPLDGQQRLTTLFLLHWLFGRKDIAKEDGHSLLVYETRDTSEEFCHWLVKQDAFVLINAWLSKIQETKELNSTNIIRWKTELDEHGRVNLERNKLRFPIRPLPSLFEYMQQDATFKWDWHNDPNIRSMVIVLADTVALIQERDQRYADGFANSHRLDNIRFMLLDNLNCDGDQLFEKMNARGKALTSFEILKSSLEEEMERQELPACNPVLFDNWRQRIDGDWLDFCWDSSDLGSQPTLDKIRGVEVKLENLLKGIAAKSFFKVTIESTPLSSTDGVNYGKILEDSISQKDLRARVIDNYLEYARHERALKSTKIALLDFVQIFNDLENLFYRDMDGRMHEASEMLAALQRSESSLLTQFIEDHTHFLCVAIYAMFSYLSISPASHIYGKAVEMANFEDWMRFVRNVFNNDNKNARIDNFNDVRNALQAIDNWIDFFKNNYSTACKNSVLELITYYIKQNPNKQEQARLDEEAIKADLRIIGSKDASGAEWEKSILYAERNPYLWGQIIAPLSWSEYDGMYDIKVFNRYVDSLNKIFKVNRENTCTDMLLMQAMLCNGDYRFNLNKDLGSLGTLNRDRDISWKRYFRTLSNGSYAQMFKDLIDEWHKPDNINLDIDQLLVKLIASNKSRFSLSDWQYYIVNISKPEKLQKLLERVETSTRFVYTEPGGHAYLFRSRTMRTERRFELMTSYLCYETSLWTTGVDCIELESTANGSAHTTFRLPNGDSVKIIVATGTLYDIEIQPNGASSQSLIPNLSVYDLEAKLKELNVITNI